jgi:hypothetical protein
LTLCLQIGPFGIELRGGPQRELQERYRGYVDAVAVVLRLEVSERELAAPTGAAANSAAAYFPRTELRGSELRIASPFVDARVDFQVGRGTILLCRHPRTGCMHYLENSLRQIAQVLAVARGAILVHAAAAVRPRDGAAFLFMGRSGSGKSTLSRLLEAAGALVLSDDLVLVEPGQASGTPFYGDFRAAAPPLAPAQRHPVRGIYLLEKAGQAATVPVPTLAQATAQLLAQLPFVECFDLAARQSSMAIALRVAAASQCATLRFRADDSVVRHLDWLEAVPV